MSGIEPTTRSGLAPVMRQRCQFRLGPFPRDPGAESTQQFQAVVAASTRFRAAGVEASGVKRAPKEAWWRWLSGLDSNGRMALVVMFGVIRNALWFCGLHGCSRMASTKVTERN